MLAYARRIRRNWSLLIALVAATIIYVMLHFLVVRPDAARQSLSAGTVPATNPGAMDKAPAATKPA